MIFDFVTITGADDEVDLAFLDDMMSKYPHVEWGILLSQTRKGTPRYPSDLWLARLTDTFYTKFDRSFSAHLCGSMCERLINEGPEIYRTGELVEHSMPGFFTRLQLNSFPEMCDKTDRINAIASALRPGLIEIILPVPNEKVEMACQRTFLDNVSKLYDGSRGTGVEPSEWPQTDFPGYVGFAGGLDPDNIKRTLDVLCSRDDDRHFWLDLETGARTDDKFDTKKVEHILRITAEYVG